MKPCPQFDKLRDALRAAGCSLQCQAQYPDPYNDGCGFETWWITRPMGDCAAFLVKLMSDDGYMLFAAIKGSTIDDDVQAILTE